MLTAEDSVWQARFPSLFNSQSLDFAGVGYRHLSMAFTLETPPDDLVDNVRVIGHSQGRLVVCSNDLGWRFLPGGTREPGEHPRGLPNVSCLRKQEQCSRGPITTFGAFNVHNSAEPYRPHLPHPDSYWLYVSGEVEVLQPPTNPPDGEKVTEVLQLPPADAIEYLEAGKEKTMAAVLRLFLEISGT